MKITVDNYRQTVSSLMQIWHKRSYFQQATFLSTINLNIKRKLFQQMLFLKGCTYLQYMNTKQQTVVINSFSIWHVCEKSTEISESEKFLNASSTRLI
jgi:hypothetical protein